MLTLLLVSICAMLVGILTGLLPALPVYTGSFILYYFSGHLSLENMMIFWLVVISGSQFFGSIATITTQIPGEESSTVYLDDINKLDQQQKNSLLYNTALGSFISGTVAIVCVYAAVTWFSQHSVLFFSSLNFQIICYTLAILSFALLNKNLIVTFILVALGILLGPKNNYALPSTWFAIQSIFQGYTFYMMVLGTMIIPQLFSKIPAPVLSAVAVVNDKSFSVIQGIKSSVIGLVTGLIPGPSAFLASLAAYKTAGADLSKKIIAAETANNASVLTCALPLLLLALPINQNTLIFSNILDMQSINIVDAIFSNSAIPGLTVIQLVSLTVMICLGIYFWLSTHLIDSYVKIIYTIHNKINYILIAILSALIIVDMHSAELSVLTYILLLSLFTLLGFILKSQRINPLPLLFSTILGDKLVWVYIQYYTIHFGR